jgi:hypothetical protein
LSGLGLLGLGWLFSGLFDYDHVEGAVVFDFVLGEDVGVFEDFAYELSDYL